MFKIFSNLTIKTRNVLMNCRSKGSFRKRDISYHRFVKFHDYRNLLMKCLGIDTSEAGKILYNYQYILDIPQKHIVEQIEVCSKLNIDLSTLVENAELLVWRTNSLKNRVLLMQEMGVPHLHAGLVSNFRIMGFERVGLFKAATGIAKDVNIAENLLKCLEEPPPSVAPLETLCETLSLNEYHIRCMQWYFKWRLNVSGDKDTRIDVMLRPSKHRSFRETSKLFHILHHDIGLSIDKIKTYNCLADGSAEELCKIIDKVKTFAGKDIRDLIKKRPELHAMKYNNVIAVIKILEDNGFREQAMRRCPRILIVNKDVFISRLKFIDSTPELRVLKNNDRALTLIYHFNRIHARLKYLRYINISYATIRMLTGSPRNFKRFIITGTDLTKSKEIGHSLEKDLKLDSNEIRRRIGKHPYWRYVDLVAIHDSLEFLLKRFKPEHLHDSLQILLYPREKICDTLMNLPELNENRMKKKYRSKEIVALCLYEMERENHFSGDGVWKLDVPPPKKPEFIKDSTSNELADYETTEAEETEESLKDVDVVDVDVVDLKKNRKAKSKQIFLDIVNKDVYT